MNKPQERHLAAGLVFASAHELIARQGRTILTTSNGLMIITGYERPNH
jgi:hypothetical protein